MDELLGSCATHSNGGFTGLFSLLLQTLVATQCSLKSPEMWPTDYAERAIEDGLDDPYDFIVVGAGTSGSVVATRLSTNWKVLLLEAGGDPPNESEIPAMTSTLINSEYSWNYYSETSEKAGILYPKGILWTSGRMLGGSSSMDNMEVNRGFEADYDEWEKLGNPSWSWKGVLPYFERSQVKNLQYENTDDIMKCLIESVEKLQYTFHKNSSGAANQMGFTYISEFLKKSSF